MDDDRDPMLANEDGIKPLKAEDIVFFILNGDEREIRLIRQALRLRANTLHEVRKMENLHELYVGDLVILQDLKPQYLNGMLARITCIDGEKFTVRLLNEPQRGELIRVVPVSCLKKVS